MKTPDLSKLPAQLELLASDPLQWQIEAAEAGKLPQFTIKAYNGGELHLKAYPYPVIVDLSGMKAHGDQIPLLRDHATTKVVGHGTAVITPTEIQATGVASVSNEHSDEVVTGARNGFQWQASIGAVMGQVQFLRAGKQAVVNGKTFSGPKIIARTSTLHEISVTAIGVDRATSVLVAAELDQGKESQMNPEFKAWLEENGFDPATISETQTAKLQASYDAEINAGLVDDDEDDDDFESMISTRKDKLKREKAIKKIVASFADENPEQLEEIEKLGRAAIKASTDPDRFELELRRSLRPSAPAQHKSRMNPDINELVLQAAVCESAGLSNLDDHFSDQILQASRDTFKGRIGLNQLLLVLARHNGYENHYSHEFNVEAQRAAFGLAGGAIQASGFSTMNASGILSNIANKFLLEGWGGGDMTWSAICKRKNVKDFKTATSYRLGGALTYEKVGPGGEIPHGQYTQDSYTNKADTYGRMLAITRTDIVNDDLDALSQMPYELGVAGIDAFNDIFWAIFLNNSTFFATGNANVSTGAGSALALAGLQAAEKVFLKQTKPNGKPLAVMPRILLVPPSLKATALTLMQSSQTVGGSTNVPDANVWRGRFEVACAPYMENTSFTGYSDAAWYLLADPRRLAVIEAAFLNGRETPFIETADAAFNTLGIQMRGVHDFGVALQEERAGVRSAGS